MADIKKLNEIATHSNWLERARARQIKRILDDQITSVKNYGTPRRFTTFKKWFNYIKKHNGK